MTLDLADCSFLGPALPEPFVKFDLEALLAKWKLLPTREQKATLDEQFSRLRRELASLGSQGGSRRVFNRALEPLIQALGYARSEASPEVSTREGNEDGGTLFLDGHGARLRVWALDVGVDLDAPSRRGRAYRFSPTRIAERVLTAQGERLALLCNGLELRVLIADPTRRESTIDITLGRGGGGWIAQTRHTPDSFVLLRALLQPRGILRLPELVEQARLAQVKVTRTLREQARSAVRDFLNEVLAGNPETLRTEEPQTLARSLWREGLTIVYRLLFLLRTEASPDPAVSFSFASSSTWRRTYSPGMALAKFVPLITNGHETGSLLEGGLRSLFKLFSEGLRSTELVVSPLGGMLFGAEATPLLDGLRWGERACASLLGNLLWTPRGKHGEQRERVHYGSLDVEDLGRVYEALLELDPGISTEPMCRLRRQKLQVVVPAAQGLAYRPATPPPPSDGDEPEDEAEDEEPDEDETPRKGSKKDKVVWVEDIPTGVFYLRVGLGRKSTGSYYTPHPFVRFLVQETLGPQVDERAMIGIKGTGGEPGTIEPLPMEILKLRVLDPAMGSGHFLVEACRYLGERLYEACRLCDELASRAEEQAEKTTSPEEQLRHRARATDLRRRIDAIPTPNDDLGAYLPSRVAEGEAAGLSQARAQALCRRLVAVHCLYGVDKNPLAVELARLSLWLESYAEGLPLTFLNHRLDCGDSLVGPSVEQLFTLPCSGRPLDENVFSQNLREDLTRALGKAILLVEDLERTIGKDQADVAQKAIAKAHLDDALFPFRQLAIHWSEAVMKGDASGDVGYVTIFEQAIAASTSPTPGRSRALSPGSPYCFELMFPEVFFPTGDLSQRRGFDAILGNPPWDSMHPLAKEFFASYDLRILDAPTKQERGAVEKRLKQDAQVMTAYHHYLGEFDEAKRAISRLYRHISQQADGQSSGAVTDIWQPFAERAHLLVRSGGYIGLVLPSAFHANQSTTGLRALYLDKASLRTCFSFENSRKLFEIHSSFKFACLVAGGTSDGKVECAFYLHDMEWLFADERPESLTYSRSFLRSVSGPVLTFPELRSKNDLQVMLTSFSGGESFGSAASRLGVSLGRELHMTDDAHRFSSAQEVAPGIDSRLLTEQARLRQLGYLPLHEGKTFHQYDDRWEDPPRYLVAESKVADKEAWLQAAKHYRLAFRDIASSTNERTGIFCLVPPGFLFGNKAPSERTPGGRPVSQALLLLAVANSLPFDFILRTKVAATVNLFILNGCPVPAMNESLQAFLVHGALRLSCNHEGYAALWTEQLGDVWREDHEKGWPAVAGEARWRLRARMDAAVAAAYGLDRPQYAHVLASFNHKSYPAAQGFCLEAFEERLTLGEEAYLRRHDPYRDVILPTNQPGAPDETFMPVASRTTSPDQLSFFTAETTHPLRSAEARAPTKPEGNEVKVSTIEQISLKNWRGHRNTTVPLSRMTLIVGENAIGKSAILEALELIGLAVGVAHENSFSGNLEHQYRQGAETEISAIVQGSGPDGSWSVGIEQQPLGSPLNVTWDHEQGLTPKKVLSFDRGDTKLEPKMFKKAKLPKESSVFLGATRLQLEHSQLVMPSRATESLTGLRGKGGGLAGLVREMKLNQSDNYLAMISALHGLIPLVDDILFESSRMAHLVAERRLRGNNEVLVASEEIVEQHTLRLKLTDGTIIPASSASEGTLFVLAVLAYICSAHRPRLLLVDDIDRGLHPRAQRLLIKQLRQLSKDYGVQIVATSHSPYLVDCFEMEEVVVLMRQGGDTGEVVARRLSEHPDAAELRDAFRTGEFWIGLGEKGWEDGEPEKAPEDGRGEREPERTPS